MEQTDSPPIQRGPIQFSPSIGKLAEALSKAQGEIEPAVKDSTNPHFRSKYADLASVWSACRGPLSKNQLSVLQFPSSTDNLVRVTTMLVHASGEYVMGTVAAYAKDGGPQSVGSAITYLRRYSLDSVVGISSDDDDGNSSQPPRQPAPPRPTPGDQFRGAMGAAAAAASAPPPQRRS